MTSRKKLSETNQTDVLTQSRRRCCICFGLHRDESVKKGQIAHLDGDRNNNSLDNLAFLCFDHHDELDGKTSQSKGFILSEVRSYRNELYAHFGSWRTNEWQGQLLSFLSADIDLEKMAAVAINVAKRTVFNGDELAYQVLVTSKVDYCDWDLLMPHLMVLDWFKSWGWLTYSQEERKDKNDDMPRTYLTVVHQPICKEVAFKIQEIIKKSNGNIAWLDTIDEMAHKFTDETA